MKRSAIATLAVIAFFAASTAYADCTCKVAKVSDGWCTDCNVGYVAGVTMKSHKLFDALMGMKIDDPSTIKCESCKEAMATNGECEHCHIAFAGGKAYHSMPACCVARGDVVDAAKVTCEACKANLGGHGWCDKCNAGVVGDRVFKDKDSYKKSLMAQELIERAAKAADKCEGCAVAMVTDGECEHCKITFKDGKPVVKKPVTP